MIYAERIKNRPSVRHGPILGLLIWLVMATVLISIQREFFVGWSFSSTPANKESSENRYDTVWPEIENKLCPNMVPNMEYGPTLFSIARDEIGMEDFSGSETDTFLTKFYRSFKEGVVYTSPYNETTIYLSIWKAAHEQIKDWAKKSEVPFEKVKSEFLPDIISEAIQSQRAAEGEASSPCIVTVIRDPISHFLSGYNEMETRLHDTPSRLGGAPPHLFNRYRPGTTERFEDFVADFLGGSERDLWKTLARLEPGHLYSMSNILRMLTKQGANLTAYLPSLNNLAEEWPKFLQKTCPGIPKEVALSQMEKKSPHASASDPVGTYAAAKHVIAQEGPTVRALCAMHAIDYACWKDLPDGVPDVCRDVFASDRFVERILRAENVTTKP